MFDVKPLERMLELRARLRERDPELAKKYEVYLSSKSRWLTSNHGLYQSILENAVLYIRGRVDEIGGGIGDSEQANVVLQAVIHDSAVAWSSQQETYGLVNGQLPSNSYMGRFGIRTLDDVADRVVSCITEGANFPDWGENTRSDLRVSPPKFYMEQFLRLERERLIGTVTAESVFLPYLRKIYGECFHDFFVKVFEDDEDYALGDEELVDLDELMVTSEEEDTYVPIEDEDDLWGYFDIAPTDTIIHHAFNAAGVNIPKIELDSDPEIYRKQLELYFKRKSWESRYLDREFRKFGDNESANEVNKEFSVFRFTDFMLLLFRRYKTEWETAGQILRTARIRDDDLDPIYKSIMEHFSKKSGFGSPWEIIMPGNE